MKGYRLADNSTIWEDGSRTGGGFNDPPGKWAYPPAGGGTLVEVATETPAQSGGYGVPILQKTPPIYQVPSAPSQIPMLQGMIEADGSTVWADGSKDYPPSPRPADPPKTWTWPVPGEPTSRPSGLGTQAGAKQPDGSVIWSDGSRTGGMVSHSDPPGTWGWPPPGGGTPTSKPLPSWERPQVVNEPQVTTPTIAVGEPAPGTSPTPPPPPAPPPMPTMDQALGSVGAWWSGLSNGTKIAAGALGAGALIAVLARGSSTP